MTSTNVILTLEAVGALGQHVHVPWDEWLSLDRHMAMTMASAVGLLVNLLLMVRGWNVGGRLPVVRMNKVLASNNLVTILKLWLHDFLISHWGILEVWLPLARLLWVMPLN